MTYDLIKMFYSWGKLTPTLEWYREHDFITNEQYKDISGKDYAPAGGDV